MPYDEQTAERVRRVLARRRNVVERKMMGTLTFLVGGAMCCCVRGDGLMVRVGPDERERALAEPHVEPVRMRGRVMSGFVLVGADGIAGDAALRRWVERGLRQSQRK